jgi:hypothetical protein
MEGAMWLNLLAQGSSPFDQLANFGAAGLMGAMWLWERRTSGRREQQLDEAHARIMSDRIQLDELLRVVKQNTAALSRLSQISTFQEES